MKPTPPSAPARLLAAALLSALSLAAAAAQTRDVTSRRPVEIPAAGGGTVKLYEKSYALVVGASEYTQGWPKLPGVKEDVRAVEHALLRQGFQVTVETDPTAERLERTFKDFITQHGMDVNNRLLLYFAGHGHTMKHASGEEMGYIVPVDAPRPDGDPAGFRLKALNMRQIERYAEDIQSKHALFLFDSCFSGSVLGLSRSRSLPDSITYKTANHVRQFIASGSAEEKVPDESIFRKQFVEGIEGEADGNKDGYVTGMELGEFLQVRVTNYSRNTQHPQYGKIRNPHLDKGDFVFAVAGATTTPPPAAAASNTPTSAPEPKPLEMLLAMHAEWSQKAAALKGLLEEHAFVVVAPDSRLKVKAANAADCALTLSGFLDTGEHAVDLTLPLKFFVSAKVHRLDSGFGLHAETEPREVKVKHIRNGKVAPADFLLTYFTEQSHAEAASEHLQSLSALCRQGEPTPSESRPTPSVSRPAGRRRPL